MVWDVVIDLFWPNRGSKTVDRLVGKLEERHAGTIRVEYRVPEAFKRGLNASGWLAEDVVAAGDMTQGKAPSWVAMITGAALIEVMRPRRSKSLPREFVLAVTADRVTAFGLSPFKEGGGETGSVTAVRITPGELASWPRGSLKLTHPYRRAGTNGGILEIAGGERFPVTWDDDSSTDELIEVLAR